MTKEGTNAICETLKSLGKRLGFVVAGEYCDRSRNRKKGTKTTKDAYTPRYDVVWNLPAAKFADINGLLPFFDGHEELQDRLSTIRFAGFEVQGTDTSSKYELGNFINLDGGGFMFNFVVTNVSDPKAKDNYRRCVKLHRYHTAHSGFDNITVIDKAHLDASLVGISKLKKDAAKAGGQKEMIETTSGMGGENEESAGVFKKLKAIIEKTGLEATRNYIPLKTAISYQLAKRISSQNDFDAFMTGMKYYHDPVNKTIETANSRKIAQYVSRMDCVVGFKPPAAFSAWMTRLAATLENDVASNLLAYGFTLEEDNISNSLLPYLAFEVESGQSKHALGSVYNLSKNSYLGVLICKKPFRTQVEFCRRNLGMTNVVSVCPSDIQW